MTDDDLSIANDPVSKLLGKSTRTARQRKAFVEREPRAENHRTLEEGISLVTGKNMGEARRWRQAWEQAHRDLAREIYDAVLRGDFGELTLQRIEQYIDESTPKNPYGRRISQRVPQAMERALHEGNRTNAVDALFTRISESTVGGTGAKLARDRSQREATKAKKRELLKGWAIATGHWYTDISSLTDGGEPIASGRDSDVYNSNDGRHVIKLSRGKDGIRFSSDIDAVNLFNHIFPNTAYDIIGYGEIGGQFVTILRQPAVDIQSAVGEDDRVAYMDGLGFHPINEAGTAFSNGQIVVSDLQKANIVRGTDGNIYVIDADVKLHTRDLGGEYTYPPASVETEDRRASRAVVDGRGENLREGSGAVSDDAVSLASAPVSKMLGAARGSAAQRRAFAERERGRMAARVRELAGRLHLDGVDVVTDASTLQGRRARAKGWYDPRTGRITVVIPNDGSVADVERTLLHEAVAHYGLRELFGEHFDTFLDNVLANADEEIKGRIAQIEERLYDADVEERTRRKGGGVLARAEAVVEAEEKRKRGDYRRTATEEYLASLAEETNFEAANRTGWWQKIKSLFLDMLHRIGFEGFGGVVLTDNELRYILWRSYENLAEPGRYRSILGVAEDIARQAALKVGRYAEDGGAGVDVAAESGGDSKSERIRKLRESEPVEITGNEIEPSDDLKQYKKNALEYGKSLRANYQNKDTGVTIQLGKTGVKEVLNHDYKNVEQLQSIAAIPQIIENSIYIDSQENTDPGKNADVSMYHYYVCGLKIGDADYTVRAVIAEQPNGNRYYDHKLTQIEKGKLLDSLSGITTPGFNQETSPISEVKDTKLLSLLQTEDEEKVLYRMADSAEDYERALVRDKYEKRAGSLLFNSAESVFDNMQSLKEAMQMIVKAEGRGRHIEEIEGFENAYLGENRLSSVNEDEMRRVARELYKPLIDAVSRLAPDKAAREALMRYMKAKHGLERNVEMRGREKERLIAEKAGRAPHDPGGGCLAACACLLRKGFGGMARARGWVVGRACLHRPP